MKKTTSPSSLPTLALLCALAPLVPACGSPDPVPDPDPVSYVVPTSEKLSGKSYGELAAEWWQWTRAIPKETNPLLDAPCDVNQTGPVFFLAGTFGGASTRSCALPANQPLFFPLLNVSVGSCPEIVDGKEYTCAIATSEDSLHTRVKGLLDSGKVTLKLDIDGVAASDLVAQRVASATFLDTAPPGPTELWGNCSGPIRENTCGVVVPSPRNMATDGFWILMRPLPAGKHELHFSGAIALPDGDFSVEVTYHLDVAS
ncbi:MAG: hypothetical protein ACMG6S_13170 [Byssovorax sp.]